MESPDTQWLLWRGKEVLVAMATRLEVGDHMISQNSSIIPIVILKLDTPENIEGSWYSGNVSVGLMEHTFQPSSAIRHVTELHGVLQHVCPILALYTDDGLDHRVNYLSVEIAFICLFLKEDRDMLVAGRTPPFNSWKDLAERVMSLLNFGAQSAGLMRKESPI